METVAKWVVKSTGNVATIIIVMLVLSYPTMWAWNYVVPSLFGLRSITVTEAWALSFLSNVLLKTISNTESKKG